jgi:hypothetical protein
MVYSNSHCLGTVPDHTARNRPTEPAGAFPEQANPVPGGRILPLPAGSASHDRGRDRQHDCEGIERADNQRGDASDHAFGVVAAEQLGDVQGWRGLGRYLGAVRLQCRTPTAGTVTLSADLALVANWVCQSQSRLSLPHAAARAVRSMRVLIISLIWRVESTTRTRDFRSA